MEKEFARIVEDVTGVLLGEQKLIADVSAEEWERRLKVCEMKDILKQCRELGFHTKIKQNKKGLAVSLHDVFSGAIPVTSITQGHAMLPPHHSSNLSGHISGGGQYVAGGAATANPDEQLFHNMIGCLEASHKKSHPNQQSVPSSQLLPISQQSQPLSTSAPAPQPLPSHSPHNGIIVPSISTDSIVNPYQHLIDELMEWGCFSSDQLNTAIRRRVEDGSPLTQDLLVMDLIGETSPPALSEEELRLQEEKAQRQFENDMDLAILNSEDGREHIQKCKKQRTISLKTDHSCKIGEAIEFSQSYLLGKRKFPEKVSTPNVIPEIVQFLDSVSDQFLKSTESSSVPSSFGQTDSLNEAALQNIRGAVVELLDLEMKSYKWYKDSALGYFVDMEKKISTSCKINCSSKDIQTYISKFVYVSTCNEKDEQNDTFSLISSIISCLKHETERLTQDLYSYSNNSSVPQAFLDCDPEKKHEMKYCLEDDGFEIL